ncbi:unnamed protein product [Symbiodinium necroappetens]|uniref:Calcineurin-like phosphoesterase domain-containing protein n=1 Tax=Symbiodinium necroappetens TaxID=1628268 RepID=A0A813BWB4_9DINO|nr:unnamed protein product [Symbiodinium necroappetens]
MMLVMMLMTMMMVFFPGGDDDDDDGAFGEGVLVTVLIGTFVRFLLLCGRLIGLQELLGMIEAEGVEMTDAPEKSLGRRAELIFPAKEVTWYASDSVVKNFLGTQVNLLMKRAEVTHQGVPVETLLDAIDCIGFDAELLEAREEAATQRDGVFGKEFVALVWPRVHVPTCSVAMFDFDSLPDATSDAGPAGARRFGVYAVSDIHTDKRENMDVIREWPRRPNDILLLAGVSGIYPPEVLQVGLKLT